MNVGYIYKLSAPDCSHVYIGCTNNPIRRFNQHKTNPTKSSKIVMEYTGVKMDILESLNYNQIHELKSRERHHIANNLCVNLKIPTRTYKEYYIDNVDKIKEKQNMIEMCDLCSKTYTKRNKARHYKKYCKPQDKDSNSFTLALLIYFMSAHLFCDNHNS